MENVFDHLFRFLKNFEVKAEPKTRKKKRWLLSREYLQPLDESDDENSEIIEDGESPSSNAKLRKTYEAAKYGMKQGVLTGVFFGGSWGIFKKFTENSSLHLTADSSEKIKDGKKEKKDSEFDTRSYTVIKDDKSSQINLDTEKPVPVSKQNQPSFIQNYQSVIYNTENTAQNLCIAKCVTNKDRVSERQPYEPINQNKYSFRKPGEKVEIVGYAFIETTGPLNGTQSSSGSNQSDGSDSSGSVTTSKSENRGFKKPFGSPSRAENLQKKNFQKEENFIFEKTSQSSSGISDTVKHSVLSMVERSINNWRNLDRNESEILSKVESNQSQDLPKWLEYSISSLPDILETSNFSSVDFEMNEQRKASLVKSLPRSASVLEEPIERFRPVNLLSSTYSKSVEARSSKHRKHEIKWGKIFEKPRLVAPEYDSDHNFLTSLKLSFLVDADAVSNGYDSDIAVNSTQLNDNYETNMAKTEDKPVNAKNSPVINPNQGVFPFKETQDQSRHKGVSPKYSKASKTILKRNASEKSSYESNKHHVHKEQNQNLFDMGNLGYTDSFVDEMPDQRTPVISSYDFSESQQIKEFRNQSSFSEGNNGIPHVIKNPDRHSPQGSDLKFSKPHAEQQYQNKYDLANFENTRPHTTEKTDRGYNKVDFVDNKSYITDTTDRSSPRESGSRFAKPRTGEQYQSEYDSSDAKYTRPHTTEKTVRDKTKDHFTNNKPLVKEPTKNHSFKNSDSKFAKSRTEEQYKNKYNLADTEDERAQTGERTNRGYSEADLVSTDPPVKETENSHSSKFSKPRAEQQYQNKYDLINSEDTGTQTTDNIDRSYNKVDFVDDKSNAIDSSNLPSPKRFNSKFDRSEIPKAQEQRRFTETYSNERTNAPKSHNVTKTQSNYKIPKPVPYVSTRVDPYSAKDSDSELIRLHAEAQNQNKYIAADFPYSSEKNEKLNHTISPTLIVPEISETDEREYNEISSAYFRRRTNEVRPPLSRTSLFERSKQSTVDFSKSNEPSAEKAGLSAGLQSSQQTDVTEEKRFRSFNLLSPLNENIIVLSACNCAIVLGVICCVISATRASLSL